jgi:transcriptional regulator with XRE-family HTH domain
METAETCNPRFPARLRQLMEETGSSQQDVANYVGVTRQAVAQWKDGKTIPDMYSFKKVAEFFSVPFSYLYGDSDSRQAQNMHLEETLGLSDDAIEMLQSYKERLDPLDENSYIPWTKLVSMLIGSSEFVRSMELLQSSALVYCNYAIHQESDVEDIFGIEYDAKLSAASVGKAVIGADEMSEFHVYQAQEILGDLLRELPKQIYERHIGMQNEQGGFNDSK